MNAIITRHAPALRALVLTSFAGAAAVGAILLGPAAPAWADSAAGATISQLEATGFDVRLNRLGNAPLDECFVTGIGRPQEHKRLTLVQGRDDDDSALVPVVVRRTITVSLDCTA
ncbi:hypothetical protein E4P42_01900 [Mycobacterium sp. PS03-16]|uniref:hypothetical protein n=1 Tax=Mycobacterium sp. PS03-16 TaxID=2559611 RepID=UPI001073696B|nr:hypothetical protein [Mycobacterium sp. PS03-16]TFV60967.1 hypothetical protein E4P42_01900 [Mycobacterium sp. PS03-16]